MYMLLAVRQVMHMLQCTAYVPVHVIWAYTSRHLLLYIIHKLYL